VKVGLEETLAATMMRTGANIVAARTGPFMYPSLRTCYVPQFSNNLSIVYIKTQFIQSITIVVIL